MLVLLLSQISVHILITYTGNRTIQLSLLYNVQYNVSITQPGICGQPNQTAYTELIYSKHCITIHADVALKLW